MSATPGADPGPACMHCGRPFGFAVPYCPFCGVAQQRPVPVPVPDMLVPPVPPPQPAQPPRPFQPPRPSPPPVPPPRPPPSPRPLPARMAEVQGERATDAAAVPPAAATASAPLKAGGRRRLRPLAFLAGLAVVAWFLIRDPPTAILVVSVQPAADGAVLVDGRPAGRAGERLHVTVGSHVIGFDAPGWSAPTRQVSLDIGQTRRLRLDLLSRPAVLTLRPDPADATVRLDGRLLNAAEAEHRVSPGWHRLVATRPGFAPLSIQITLGRGERRMVPLLLSPLPVRPLDFQAPVGIRPRTVTLPVTLPLSAD